MEEARKTVSTQGRPTQIREDEFSQLRSVLPSITAGRYTSPIEVIEEAIKYIAHLQATLEDHDSSSMTTEEVQQQFRERSPSIKTRIKLRERKVASFHARLNYVPKPRTLRGHERRTKKKQTPTDT
ncbi:uncharacterized protein LOC114517911 [Dendronephthya gigantea]|uniref:uncharacterized protein LOC114517911 n=1 Tax=Dendronephthya gigantea TaxID=151771 RepID=UPI0010690875|nr:uncharacterized protein LOC114517911 [Dendronephthya gigantea]